MVFRIGPGDITLPDIVRIYLTTDASFFTPDKPAGICVQCKFGVTPSPILFYSRFLPCKTVLCAELEAIYYGLFHFSSDNSSICLTSDCHNAVEILDKSAKGQIRLKGKSYGEVVQRINRLIKQKRLHLTIQWKPRKYTKDADADADKIRLLSAMEFKKNNAPLLLEERFTIINAHMRDFSDYDTAFFIGKDYIFLDNKWIQLTEMYTSRLYIEDGVRKRYFSIRSISGNKILTEKTFEYGKALSPELEEEYKRLCRAIRSGKIRLSGTKDKK